MSTTHGYHIYTCAALYTRLLIQTYPSKFGKHTRGSFCKLVPNAQMGFRGSNSAIHSGFSFGPRKVEFLVKGQGVFLTLFQTRISPVPGELET